MRYWLSNQDDEPISDTNDDELTGAADEDDEFEDDDELDEDEDEAEEEA